MKPKTSDGRNITDNYFGWENLDIKEDLDSKRFNYGVLCCNIVGDYNLSCIVRTANVFLAKEVIIYGNKSFDRRGAVGTHHYTNFSFVKRGGDLSSVTSRYDTVVAVDNIPEAENIELLKLERDRSVLFCFGEERAGLCSEVLTISHKKVFIRQYGSCRSLNVAVTAGIVMHRYVNEVR